MNKSQLDTISTITRYTLLSGMAIGAKSIDLLYYAIFLANDGEGELDKSMYHLIKKWMFVPVLFVEIISIWLTFGFNGERYQWCCRLIHNECEEDCTKLAQRKLRNYIIERRATREMALSVSGNNHNNNDIATELKGAISVSSVGNETMTATPITPVSPPETPYVQSSEINISKLDINLNRNSDTESP